MVNKNPPQSVIGRGLRLGRLGLSLTGSYMGYQAQNLWFGEEDKDERRRDFQKKASRQVREELGSLKGPIMKLGQILSMQSHALPDEALSELANLQMHAPGMHPTLARAQFKTACGKYPEEVFRVFEPEPFAAASLGQVHKAVTKNGERAVVKIQYPAIRAAIENDLKLLRSATLPGRLTGYAPVSIIEEIQRGFLEETDYVNEGRNLDFFRERMAGFTYLDIPRVHWELTTDRVLTMSFLEGEHVGQFLQAKPSQELRNLIGFRLFEIYHFQVQSCHALHADHHPGNYLFQPDGRIGLVDFGCVKRLTPEIAELARLCVSHTWMQDTEAAKRVAEIIWGSKVSLIKARRMLANLDELVRFLFPDVKASGGVVNFGDSKFLKMLGRGLGTAVRDKLTNPEFAFLSRADIGLYNLLHHLGAKVNTREVWNQLMERTTKAATQIPDRPVGKNSKMVAHPL